MQAQELALAIADAGHHPLPAAGKFKARAGRQRLAAAQLNERFPIARQALDQGLDTPAAGPPAAQPGANHARVVQQQQVTGAQQGRQVGEGEVARRPIRPAGAAGDWRCAAASGCWAISASGSAYVKSWRRMGPRMVAEGTPAA